MKSIEINEIAEQILINGLNNQKEVLTKQLKDIDTMLDMLLSKPVAPIEPAGLTWFERITQALEHERRALTTREILDMFYLMYDSFDKNNDREYMGSVSTTLNQHIKRKGDKAMIRKIIEEGKETRFELIK